MKSADYHLTTICKKLGAIAPQWLRVFSVNDEKIVQPHRNPCAAMAFHFDGLRTPTFQARSVERWRKALGVFGFNGQREKILFPLTTI
ncbi:hypothetical protein [Dysosmobacter welbionis]